MAKSSKGPKDGRPPGRIGKGGVGPAAGAPYRGTRGGGGTSHKGGTTSSGSSGSSPKSIVIGMALVLGIPFLLFLASVGYVVVAQ